MSYAGNMQTVAPYPLINHFNAALIYQIELLDG
jgi:hypothetical protein